MFDLDAYLERIGLQGRPDIVALHRAHVTSIPFENLDPHCGVPVSLAGEDIERKLVAVRRGGYCFEQNLLLKAGLEALGAEVDVLLARVRFGSPRGSIRPRTHVVLRVRAGGESWHADVGFGLGSLLEPIPFGAGAVYEQSGWRFRVVDEDAEMVLQTELENGWVDLYGFVPQPVPHVDLETSNWYTSTHPHSPFVTRLIVAAQSADGTRTSLDDRSNELSLTVTTPAATVVTAVAWGDVPALLAERFGLHGYTLGAANRLVAR